MIRLQLCLVRCLVLGADQGVRRSGSLRRNIQVALWWRILSSRWLRRSCLMLNRCTDSCGSSRNRLSSAQSAHLHEIRRHDGSRWVLRGLRGQMLQLLAARGNPARQSRSGYLDVLLEPGAQADDRGKMCSPQRVLLRQGQGVRHEARQQFGLSGDRKRRASPESNCARLSFARTPVAGCIAPSIASRAETRSRDAVPQSSAQASCLPGRG